MNVAVITLDNMSTTSIGSVFSVDLTDPKFAHFNRSWCATLTVLHFGSPISTHNTLGPPNVRESVSVALMKKISSALPASPFSTQILKIVRFLPDFDNNPSVEYVGCRELTSTETQLANMLDAAASLGQAAFKSPFGGYEVDNSFWGVDFELMQETFSIPRSASHLDCGVDYTTHCLKCCGPLTDTIARCHQCGEVRLGFESIAAYVMDWTQEVSSDLHPQLFGCDVVAERDVTDVQGPDGKWHPAFHFLEEYLRSKKNDARKEG